MAGLARDSGDAWHSIGEGGVIVAEKPKHSMLIRWSDASQAYVVSFPEWEAAGWIGNTHGETYEQAAKKGRKMLQAYLWFAKQEAEPAPAPREFDEEYAEE
jgi:predicted RNase H-like HicB family nuclease